MFKKLLSTLTAICLILGTAATLPEGIVDDFVSTIKAQAANTIDSGQCGDNAYWTLDSEGTLTISGTGEMYDFYPAGDEYSPFESKSTINRVNINDGITSIGWYAFYDCDNLESITIANSVTSIGGWALFNTQWLKEKQINNPLVIENGILIDACMCEGNVTIPNNVTSIGVGAFYNSQITSVIIPNCAKSIGLGAFDSCKNLTSISIPDSVTSIGKGAFYDCTGLTSISISNSITCIDDHTFGNCSNLKSITIPNSVTSIGDDAFEKCTNLKSLTISRNYDKNVFNDCINISSITLSSDLTYISSEFYRYFSNLTNINVDTNNQYYTSENGVLYNKDKTQILCCPRKTALTNITIPSSVTRINDYAFYYCKNLTNIIIPNSVTSIGNSAFTGCSGLKEITIPSNVSNIGNSSFSGCSNLTSINIPAGVTKIGSNTFYKCTSLTDISIPNSVTSIGDYAFQSCKSLKNITIPNSVTSIGYYAFDSCSNLTSIDVDSGNTNYSSSNGILYNKNKTQLICCPNGIKLTSFIIPNSVTNIEKSAFNGCSNLTSISIPLSVTSIGDYAFIDCNNLTITSHKDSVADKYAIKNKIKHISLPHDYSSEIIRKTSCYAEGEIRYTCKECGSFYSDAIPVTEHSYTSIINKEATCISEGKVTNTCDICGNVSIETIPITDHQYTAKVIAPPYDKQGYTEHTCSVCGDSYKDNYTDKLKRDISSCSVALSQSSYVYDGNAKTPTVTVKNGSTTLKKDTDYTVTYANNKAPGSATVTITGTGDYTGSVDKTFDITHTHSYSTETSKSATCKEEGLKTYVCKCGYSYTSSTPKLTTHSYTLTATKAATCAQAGTKKFTCSVCGESYTTTIPKLTTHSYTSKETKATTCTEKGVKTYTCSVCGDSYTESIPSKGGHKYTKQVISPTYDEEGYTEYTCSVCGDSYKDNYTDKLKKTDISNYSVTLDKSSYTYDGTAKTPSVTVKSSSSYYYSSNTLTLDKDYTVSYSNNINEGSATATVTGIGAYKGTINKSFSIVRGISDFTVTLSQSSYTYDGYSKKPSVKVSNNSKTLTEGTDYTLSYYDNTAPGTATVKVTGKGYYTGYVNKFFTIDHTHSYSSRITKSATCTDSGIRTYSCMCGSSYTESIPSTGHKYTTKTIAPTYDAQGYTLHTCANCGNNYKDNYKDKLKRPLSSATVTLSSTSFTYTGKAIKPSVTVKLAGKTLKSGTDYSVSYSNNTNIGTAKVTISGKNNYTGSVCKTFSIKKPEISKCSISGLKTSYSYTGKAIKPSFTVKNGSVTLKKGTDYTVSYKNNKQLGTATITIKGKGKYTGSISKQFKIVPKTPSLKSVTGVKNYKNAFDLTGSLTVNWNKVSGVTGYELIYSFNKDFKKPVKSIKVKSTSCTVKNLCGMEIYYFKVRAYKTVKGKTHYSSYSSVMTGIPLTNIVNNGSKMSLVNMLSIANPIIDQNTSKNIKNGFKITKLEFRKDEVRQYVTWDLLETTAYVSMALDESFFHEALGAFYDLSIAGKKVLNSMGYKNMHFSVYVSGERTSHNGEYSPKLCFIIRDGYGTVVNK